MRGLSAAPCRLFSDPPRPSSLSDGPPVPHPGTLLLQPRSPASHTPTFRTPPAADPCQCRVPVASHCPAGGPMPASSGCRRHSPLDRSPSWLPASKSLQDWQLTGQTDNRPRSRSALSLLRASCVDRLMTGVPTEQAQGVDARGCAAGVWFPLPSKHQGPASRLCRSHCPGLSSRAGGPRVSQQCLPGAVLGTLPQPELLQEHRGQGPVQGHARA